MFIIVVTFEQILNDFERTFTEPFRLLSVSEEVGGETKWKYLNLSVQFPWAFPSLNVYISLSLGSSVGPQDAVRYWPAGRDLAPLGIGSHFAQTSARR